MHERDVINPTEGVGLCSGEMEWVPDGASHQLQKRRHSAWHKYASSDSQAISMGLVSPVLLFWILLNALILSCDALHERPSLGSVDLYAQIFMNLMQTMSFNFSECLSCT